MKVIDLRGRGIVWSFKGCRVLGDESRPRSSLHLRARQLLKSVLPSTIIYEEVKIPSSRLRYDFVVPIKNLVIEVQGQQHFEYNEFFHKSKYQFVLSLERDQEKVRFAEINNLAFVEFPYNESDEEWKTRLLNTRQPKKY